jgi:hypothetical protein
LFQAAGRKIIAYFCGNFQELVSVLYRYARENLALVNIYIKDPAVTKIKRDQRVPVIWFIANVGGILGLSMGCSLVTVFEILHHLLLLFFLTGKRSISTFQKTVRQLPPQPPDTGEADEII